MLRVVVSTAKRVLYVMPHINHYTRQFENFSDIESSNSRAFLPHSAIASMGTDAGSFKNETHQPRDLTGKVSCGQLALNASLAEAINKGIEMAEGWGF